MSSIAANVHKSDWSEYRRAMGGNRLGKHWLRQPIPELLDGLEDREAELFGKGDLAERAGGGLPSGCTQNGIAAADHFQIAIEPNAIGRGAVEIFGVLVRADAGRPHLPDLQCQCLSAANVLKDLPLAAGTIRSGDVNEFHRPSIIAPTPCGKD